ncbi:MAG: hypothetical protein GF310_10220 [candidate division Zixibacteria bacterium]|nr:hypothetical protein [candidate division Zixibacteria bacterium]
MSRLKKSVIAALLLVFGILTGTISGQNDMQTTQDQQPGPQLEHTWSFQAGISEYFTLRNFDMVSLSVKRHFSNKSALRLGTWINFWARETSQSEIKNWDGTNADTEIENRYYFAALSLQYITYLSSGKDVKCYLGIGPRIRFEYWKTTYESKSDALTRLGGDSGEIFAGLQSNLGAEYFFTDNISLIAEYGAILDFWGYSDLYNYKNELSSGFRFSLSPLPVNFGVSIYF